MGRLSGSGDGMRKAWIALAGALALGACGEESAGGGGDAAARAARTGVTPTRSETVEDWVVGNVVFMLYHEVGHALISEFELPVLGREEDAVDQFATVLLAPTEEQPDEDATRNLLDAMDGWFRSSQQTALEDLAWWDEHGPDQQRAYGIACLLYGSDPEAFGPVADEVELPEERRERCAGDFETASTSWWRVLDDHLLPDNAQPRQRVNVVYADAAGFEAEAGMLRRSAVMQAVADDLMHSFNLRRPLTIRAEKCEESNAYWDADTGTVHLCYELLREFSELHGGGAENETIAEGDADTLDEASAAADDGAGEEDAPDEDPAPAEMTQTKKKR